MQDIYLDTYHLHSLSTVLPTRAKVPVTGLESPDNRLDVYDRPGRHGQTVANALYGGRPISLTGTIHGTGATDILAQADYRLQHQLFIQASAHQYDAGGHLVPRILKLTDLTGAQYRVSVVKEKLVLPDDNPSMGTWMLDLRATDWRIYAEMLLSTSLSLPQSGGITFPITYTITFGASSGGSATVTNSGTVEASPIVTINGPAINPVVSNDTTGQSLGLNLTLVSGDQVVIDMDNATILQGGSTNRMGGKSSGSRFWSLTPGVNTIRFSADAYDVGTAVIAFRSAHLGI